VRLRYTARACRHLDAIAEYIAERNPDAARKVGVRIRETIDLLTAFPQMGRVGVLPRNARNGRAGITLRRRHRVDVGEPDTLVILGIYHGAQLRPGQKSP
jgi:toxin ParE1/3/4